MLTVVAYHYVRDLPNTRFPEIKGLLSSDFDAQLDYLAKHYEMIDISRVVAAAAGDDELPANACLLTFDDGFSDHYENVFPRLRARRMTGAFYAPGCATIENKLLDVHKIHHVLASGALPAVTATMLKHLSEFRSTFALPSDSELAATHAVAGKFDAPEVMFVKRLLQTVLPEPARVVIVGRLFREFVTADEADFARTFYMTIPQMREMADAGMSIGGHGYLHYRLGALPPDEQRVEVQRMVEFLSTVHGALPAHWTLCYPYGSYDATTVALVREAGAALAFTGNVGLIEDFQQPLELKRLDTNDLPKAANAPQREWTRRGLTPR